MEKHTFSMTGKDIEGIDRLKEALGVNSRSETLRRLIALGVDRIERK